MCGEESLLYNLADSSEIREVIVIFIPKTPLWNWLACLVCLRVWATSRMRGLGIQPPCERGVWFRPELGSGFILVTTAAHK